MTVWIVGILFFALGFWFLYTSGQTSYQFSQLNVGKDLSHKKINNIYKDRTGFVWSGACSFFAGSTALISQATGKRKTKRNLSVIIIYAVFAKDLIR